MYKCQDCGHIFDAGEQAVWVEAHGEEMDGCPLCKGGYEETISCKFCGGEFVEDEIYDGICIECLTDRITYDTALDYLTERDYFVHFMMCRFFENGDYLENPSEKFTVALREIYNRMKCDDILRDAKDFLNVIRDYILNDDDDYGKRDFAEWLNERE